MVAPSDAFSSKAPQSNDTPALKDQTTEKQPQESQVSGLEEDDEFEEFAVQDWDDSKTNLAHLGGAAPGSAKSVGDNLWEDNWDDDDVEDDFSVQLRNELTKTGAGEAGGEAMQH